MSLALTRSLTHWPLRRALLLLPALALLALAAGFARFLMLAAAEPADPARPTDGIAVLTGGAGRVETGLRLLRQGQARVLLVSGTHPRVTLADVAHLAAMQPEELAGRVRLGHDATSTRGNAAEIAAWARAERLTSLRIVTAGYHMPRALLELHRALPEVALLPHPMLPARLRQAEAATRLGTWSLLGREYLKYLAVWAGLAAPDPPPADGKTT